MECAHGIQHPCGRTKGRGIADADPAALIEEPAAHGQNEAGIRAGEAAVFCGQEVGLQKHVQSVQIGAVRELSEHGRQRFAQAGFLIILLRSQIDFSIFGEHDKKTGLISEKTKPEKERRDEELLGL